MHALTFKYGNGKGWIAGILLMLSFSNPLVRARRVEFQRDFAPTENWIKSVEQPYRQDMCLNGSWQFQPVPIPEGWKRNTGVAPELTLPVADHWDTTFIKIPSPWNVNAWGPGRNVGEGTERPYWPSSVYYPSYPSNWTTAEMGWLRRTFLLPQSWGGSRIVLHFEAVAGDAQVFVNGRKAGGHFGSHLPFELDITDLMKPDAENELLVGVRSMNLFDQASERYRRMRSPYPPGSNTDNLRGIWQDVFLLALPAVRAADVFVKPFVDRDTLEVEVTLRNDSKRPQRIDIIGHVQPWVNLAGASILDAPEPNWRLDPSVLDLKARRVDVKPGESAVARLAVKVGSRLKFWSPDTPNLYGLVLSVDAGGQSLDRSYTRFGWRQVKIAGRNVLLNGQKIQMFGDLLHPFGPFVNSRRYTWAWYSMIKNMHGNAVRPHAQPHPRHYLDLADEMGLLVLDETAMFGSSIRLNFEAPAAWERYAENYDNLILRDRNHPSVFGWSWGNELFAIFSRNEPIDKEQADAWYAQLVALGNRGRMLDPTHDWISCDGDEDVRGSMPVWNKHFGYGLPDPQKLPADLDKPLMVGESGGTYYARPGQLAVFNGDRAYESYLGRNEALAIDVYDNVVNLALPKLAYFSPAETAWFGIEHLNFGYRDFTRLPNAQDGVWFKPFEEGKPGVQPERLPPYVATLNPGWDPGLPLYKPLPMFKAQKAAQAVGGPQPCPWDHKPEIQKSAVPAVTSDIKRVAFIGTLAGELHKHLSTLGLPLADASKVKSPKLLLVDAETLTEAMLPAAKKVADAVLANRGTVLVMCRSGETTSPVLDRFLPVPVVLTSRRATSLVSRSGHAWTAGMGLADLYFAEDRTDRYILKCGLDGDLVKQGRVLLAASNTDWSLFNNAPENTKCAAVVLYETLIKPNGAALVERTTGRGHMLVSSMDVVPTSEANMAFWRKIFTNAGVQFEKPDRRPVGAVGGSK